MSKVLFLIGMPGSGKTTCGKEFAHVLQCSFIDTDDLIEHDLAKKSIEQIFRDEGENAFRQLEQKALENVVAMSCNGQFLVVATGGGMPLIDENFQKMSIIGEMIYLSCKTDILAQRLIKQFESEKKERPLLNLASGQSELSDSKALENLKKKLDGLIQKREPIYIKAHHCIDTSDFDKNGVVERLKAFL